MASPSLPCRALSLIREYSKPLTHPEWRKSNPVISQYKLHSYVTNHIVKNFKLKEYLSIGYARENQKVFQQISPIHILIHIFQNFF